MTVTDFRKSAAVSEPMLTNFGLSVGEKIYRAVQATWDKVGCNTNLGIISAVRTDDSSRAGSIHNGFF